MRVLIVESNRDLGTIWKRHIERCGATVSLVSGQEDAIDELQRSEPQVIVLNLLIDSGSAFAIADYAAYRYPDTKVVFVTSKSFFSDGSIFKHIPNACAFLPSNSEPGDLATIVDYYGAIGAARAALPN